MRVDSFPDIIRQNVFANSITSSKRALTDASIELVTGRKSDLSRVLGGRAGEYNLITKALSELDSTKARYVIGGSRLSQTGASLKAIRTEIDGLGLRAEASLLTNGDRGFSEIQQSARFNLDSVVSTLNGGHAGRNLFSGDNVHNAALSSAQTLLDEVNLVIAGAADEAAIDAAITTFFGAGGGYETTIYQGGAGQAAALKLSSGSEIRHTVKADDQAIRDVLEGLVRIAVSDPNASTEWAESLGAKLRVGTDGLIALESNIGRNERLIENAIEAGQKERLILTESSNALVGVDPFEAATKVQALESQLEAAYTVAARLSSLTFTNYIR